MLPEEKPYYPKKITRRVIVPVLMPLMGVFYERTGFTKWGSRQSPQEWHEIDWPAFLFGLSFCFVMYYLLYLPFCRWRLRNWEARQEYYSQEDEEDSLEDKDAS